ncbi:hypothetical protein [Adhaeribacter aerolatus]|uniref:hypothetical protein n=1 Tax=Adhaeribacter aerolatus TaxID=670289 RepID=UPI0027D94D3A|nr:hypothetical protein [Adhaeribacter aerolatus]
MQQHYENRGNSNSFAGKYYCYRLLFFERYTDINHAIEREKELKQMSRKAKEEIISQFNPNWNFLVAILNCRILTSFLLNDIFI